MDGCMAGQPIWFVELRRACLLVCLSAYLPACLRPSEQGAVATACHVAKLFCVAVIRRQPTDGVNKKKFGWPKAGTALVLWLVWLDVWLVGWLVGTPTLVGWLAGW